MASILYEHPLNETIRNFLKLENSFRQLHFCSSKNIEFTHQVFFTSLFSIIDTLERNDIRGDMIKELERLEQNLILWSKSPDVDNNALQHNLAETIQLLALLKPNQQVWWQLKQHKLLASLKQRFSIQGGSCLFDLPQLSYWLNLPENKIANDMQLWLTMLENVSKSLALILRFIRLRNDFEKISTDSGFYQDSGEGILLLRIKLPANAGYYPTISGNRFRYSIRFMLPCEESGKRYANQATTFELARC
jgi:cell division protein ZapD